MNHRTRIITTAIFAGGLITFTQGCVGGFKTDSTVGGSGSTILSSTTPTTPTSPTTPGIPKPPTIGGEPSMPTTPTNTSNPTNPTNPITPAATPTPTPAPPTPVTPISGGGIMPDPTVTGHKLTVCASGCDATNLSGAIGLAVDGDTIEVQYSPSGYQDCAWVNQNNLIIRGVLNASGQRPKIFGKVCGRKGIIVIGGANVLIENLELSNAQDTGFGDNNWAGIRIDTNNVSKNLKVRNCYFHDDDNGILGSNNDPAVTGPSLLDIESSIFDKCGRSGFAHGMYVGSGYTRFALRNSIIMNNGDDGHLVKTRAHSGVIECNTIASLNGANSFAIDIPQGGNYLIQKNVIEQGPRLNNGGNYFVQFARENQNNSPHKLSVQNNVFINDYAGKGQIADFANADVSGWISNIFAGNGDSLTLPAGAAASSFMNYSTRAAGGYPAFDGTLNSLPKPPACP